MKNIKMIISIACAVLWTYNGIANGFDVFGVCAMLLWWLAAGLFIYGYFKRKKQEGSENG